MATSVPGVFAADDVADAYLPAIERRLRSEHWANAITGGRIAARGMLGERTSYNEISYFYTDQYDRGMEYSGYAPLTQGAEVVYRGDPDAQEVPGLLDPRWLGRGRYKPQRLGCERPGAADHPHG